MTETATAPEKQSFADMIDYDAQFAELAKRGILFSDADKARFRTICTEELRKYDGNSTLGTSLGASGTSWVYMLFAFIQNIFSGKGELSLEGIGDRLSSAGDRAGEQGKLHMLEQATMRIYDRFRSEGGAFTHAAELVTQKKLNTGADATGPQDMDNSIYHQLRDQIDLPANTSANLNKPNRNNTGRG